VRGNVPTVVAGIEIVRLYVPLWSLRLHGLVVCDIV
jgi:hypothetical protein